MYYVSRERLICYHIAESCLCTAIIFNNLHSFNYVHTPVTTPLKEFQSSENFYESGLRVLKKFVKRTCLEMNF